MKFNDANLIGVPLRLTVGDRGSGQGRRGAQTSRPALRNASWLWQMCWLRFRPRRVRCRLSSTLASQRLKWQHDYLLNNPG